MGGCCCYFTSKPEFWEIKKYFCLFLRKKNSWILFQFPSQQTTSRKVKSHEIRLIIVKITTQSSGKERIVKEWVSVLSLSDSLTLQTFIAACELKKSRISRLKIPYVVSFIGTKIQLGKPIIQKVRISHWTERWQISQKRFRFVLRRVSCRVQNFY